MIPAGKYVSKVVDHGLYKGKKGVMAVITMRLDMGDGGTKDLNWYGSFNGGARPYTIDTLVRCGFEGNNVATLHRAGVNGDLLPMALDTEKEFECVVEQSEYNGRISDKIAWINDIGGGSFRDKMSNEEANVLIGGLNLGADLMEARQRSGKAGGSQRNAAAAPQVEQPAFTEDDIPF